MGDESEGGKPKEVAPVPPRKKRSLFTKSASTATEPTEDAVDFFSRGKDLFPQLILEDQRKREKKREKLEQKRSTQSVEVLSCSPPGGKRRRVSPPKEADRAHNSDDSHHDEDSYTRRRESSTSTPGSRNSRLGAGQTEADSSPTSLSGRYSEHLRIQKRETPKPVQADKGYISVSDSDSENEVVVVPPRRTAYQPNSAVEGGESHGIPRKAARPPPPPVEDDLQMDEDEEFPELVLQAREREKQRALQKEQQAKAFSEKNQRSGEEDFDDDIFGIGPPRTQHDLDPTVEIFITSQMDGTKPLLVKRKLSGRFKEVRLSWCDKQQTSNGISMGPTLKDKIFLTWRGKRLFDSTSCQALGLKLDDHGRLSANDGVDADGRVHLEAWSEEAFKKYQKKAAVKQQRVRDNSMGVDFAEEENEEPIKKIRLVMKARDMEFKLVVKPHTTFEKMILAFREGKHIPQEKKITLHWDGEILEPFTTIGETELEDLDNVEVHID